MKFQIKDSTNRVPFGNLCVKDMFLYESDVYMKIENGGSDKIEHGSTFGWVNCVNMNTGMLRGIQEEILVEELYQREPIELFKTNATE